MLTTAHERTVALGGDPSPQEAAIISETVKTMLFIALLDANLLGLQSLERKGRVHSAISDTMRLAGHLRDNLRAIGLKRVAKDVPNLARLLADLQKQQEASNG